MGKEFSGRRALAGSLTILCSRSAGLGLGLVAALYIARTLGPGDYGLWALVAAIVFWPELIITSLLVTPSIKLLGQAEHPRAVQATIVRSGLILGLCGALVIASLATPLSAVVQRPQIATYLLVFALHIPLNTLFATHCAALLAQGRYALFGSAGLVLWGLYLALAVSLLESGLGIWGVVASALGAWGAAAAFCHLWVRPSWRHPRAPKVRELWKRASPLMLSVLGIRLFLRLGPVLLALTSAASVELGHYGACLNLLLVASTLSLAMSSILLANLAGSMQPGGQDKVHLYAQSALRSGWWLLPMAAAAASASEELVVLIFGPAFASAGPVMALITLACVGRYQYGLVESVIAGLGRGRALFRVTYGLLPALVLAYGLGLTPGGAIGLALLTAMGTMGTSLILYFFAWRALDQPPGWATMIRCTLLAGLTYLAGALWPAAGLLALLKVAGLSLAGLLGLAALGELNARDWRFLRSLLRRTEAAKTLDAA